MLEIERRTGNKIAVRGHRDHIATSCPGERVYRHIKRGTFLQAPGEVAAPVAPAPAPAPSPAPAGCSAQTLRRGAQGDCVKELQRKLRAAGHDPGPADGKFGPRTEAAVRALQKARSTRTDGVVGPKTWGLLG